MRTNFIFAIAAATALSASALGAQALEIKPVSAASFYDTDTLGQSSYTGSRGAKVSSQNDAGAIVNAQPRSYDFLGLEVSPTDQSRFYDSDDFAHGDYQASNTGEQQVNSSTRTAADAQAATPTFYGLDIRPAGATQFYDSGSN